MDPAIVPAPGPRVLPSEKTRTGRTRRQRGQVLAIFAGATILFVGILAIVIDVSWYWANSLRVQRAADAAALAGVVWLPGDISSAQQAAYNEATKDGFTTSSGGVTITAQQDSTVTAGGDPDQLDVSVTAPVKTFFMRLFGINAITATRSSKALYVQPVPMGSPLNYYGVYQDCQVAGSSIACSNLPGASGPSTLASQGFFGAVEGQGSDRGTGDAYATGYNSDPAGNTLANSGGLVQQQYDPLGYNYQIEVPGGGTVYVYDPTFCATTSGPGGGHLGAGDHWLSTTNHGTAVPVSTYYKLWDTKGTQTTVDDSVVASSGSLFQNEFQADLSNAYAKASGVTDPVTGNKGLDNNFSDGTEPPISGGGAVTDCSAGKISNVGVGGYWHNKWWPIASGIAAGVYRLQITTTDPVNPSLNAAQAFENMWSIEVVGGGSPKIYGAGRMVSYANIQSGQQVFYLAQIDQKSGAGKTIEIDLFDPGDVGQAAWMQILNPDGNVYTPATFAFSFDSRGSTPQSTTGQTCIQTYSGSSAASAPAGCPKLTSGGTQFFGNSWVRIIIPLQSTYGVAGLQPAGEPAPGWWKVRYTVQSGNDTTTWQVNILGNPVHLIVP